MSGQAVENGFPPNQIASGGLTVNKAVEENLCEVLTFLSERPIHTFGMVGMIVTNGLISPTNRGIFYTCRNHLGQLEGVALLGYDNLFEVRNELALAAFARLFREIKRPRL